jgi:hypothetical protein
MAACCACLHWGGALTPRTGASSAYKGTAQGPHLHTRARHKGLICIQGHGTRASSSYKGTAQGPHLHTRARHEGRRIFHWSISRGRSLAPGSRVKYRFLVGISKEGELECCWWVMGNCSQFSKVAGLLSSFSRKCGPLISFAMLDFPFLLC